MKSRKYNKFRKNRKKTQKKVYKKTEKKVNKKKHNRKTTYRKKGGAKELCLEESQSEPSENNPEVALKGKCNEYFFEEYDFKNNKYDYYAWRNPDNTFRKYDKTTKCRLVDNFKKYKQCPERVYKLKREERRQIKEDERNRQREIEEENRRLADELRREEDERREQQILELQKDIQKQRSRDSQISSKKSEKKSFGLTEEEKAERRIKKKEFQDRLSIIDKELEKLNQEHDALSIGSFASDYGKNKNIQEELHKKIRELQSEKENIELSLKFLHI